MLIVFNANGFVDLPRDANGVAIIGDPRNDENLIICQLHIAFMTLHNYFLDHQALGVFALAKQLTLYHYQWIIVHDFLPHVVGQNLLDAMLLRNPVGRQRAHTRGRCTRRPTPSSRTSRGRSSRGASATCCGVPGSGCRRVGMSRRG